ncbi:hypothetical protein HS088_TW14G00004 [Tripterygium wilfordii]|uniref:Uncharacterized protein n=1 Tax=Tripterygium wilfordii TaxID=458696 RepID=A0A7J7CP65_TRIWF|nr:hypothetical protein HS088_TW14G00004 [Tripterygium wilfordii]
MENLEEESCADERVDRGGGFGQCITIGGRGGGGRFRDVWWRSSHWVCVGMVGVGGWLQNVWRSSGNEVREGRGLEVGDSLISLQVDE